MPNNRPIIDRESLCMQVQIKHKYAFNVLGEMWDTGHEISSKWYMIGFTN